MRHMPDRLGDEEMHSNARFESCDTLCCFDSVTSSCRMILLFVT